MYEWKNQTVERWIQMVDDGGNRHLFRIERIRRVYEALAPSTKAFASTEPKRAAFVEFDDGRTLRAADTFADLVKTIVGKGAGLNRQTRRNG